MKRNKKNDKFFSRMRNGVKSLWKVLKHRDPLLSLRKIDDDDIYEHLSQNDGVEVTDANDEETDNKESQ